MRRVRQGAMLVLVVVGTMFLGAGCASESTSPELVRDCEQMADALLGRLAALHRARAEIRADAHTLERFAAVCDETREALVAAHLGDAELDRIRTALVANLASDARQARELATSMTVAAREAK
ncbi:MAG TPA: hypothetical protein VFG69_11005, partial [Nannocystaceae bacterium]|nr:hypothetical protein [Nannocystaceae bacterium]